MDVGCGEFVDDVWVVFVVLEFCELVVDDGFVVFGGYVNILCDVMVEREL